MARALESVVAFYNKRRTREQFIKEGEGAQMDAHLLSLLLRRRGAAPASRAGLQPSLIAAGLWRHQSPIKDYSLTTLGKKLIKIGAKVGAVAVTPRSRWRGSAFRGPVCGHPTDNRRVTVPADQRELCFYPVLGLHQREKCALRIENSAVAGRASTVPASRCALSGPPGLFATAPPSRRHKLRGSLEPNRGPSGESQLYSGREGKCACAARHRVSV